MLSADVYDCSNPYACAYVHLNYLRVYAGGCEYVCVREYARNHRDYGNVYECARVRDYVVTLSYL